jgi:hypothetical protein
MSEEEVENNLAMAMDKVLDAEGVAVSAELDADNGPAGKQILIRIPEKDRERWKQASEIVGKTMSQLIRDSVNDSVAGILDCQHPMNRRRFYPWAEFCLDCGQRLRG